MKKAEIILGTIALIGILMKFLLIPGHGFLILFSIVILSGMYFFFGFSLFNDIPFRNIFKRETFLLISTPKLIGTIGLGFSFSNITMGILYKIQNYPGYVNQLEGGLLIMIIILIVALVQYQKNKSNFYIGIFSRMLIIGSLGLIMLLTSQDWLMRVIHRDNPEYLEQINRGQ